MEVFFSLILVLISQFLGIDLSQTPPPIDEAAPVEDVAQVLHVIDGDTIKVRISGMEETVRYIGIDTPEPYRDGEPACYSKEASDRNSDMVAGREVRLVPDEENRDRFGRLLRYVYVDDVFVNQQLLREGYATTLTISPNTQFESQFRNAESSARSAGEGLWSACGSI